MEATSIKTRFQSIFHVLTHFSCSLIQLSCALGILGLQIALTVTETCAFHVGVGFWTCPSFLAAPVSIWILLWKRNLPYCWLSFVVHICSTLFATAVIIVSFLGLIGQIGSPCSTSSSTNVYFLPINVSLIVVALTLKLFLYAEMLLLYLLQRRSTEPAILSDKQFHERNYQIVSNDVNVKPWKVFRSMLKESEKNSHDLDV